MSLTDIEEGLEPVSIEQRRAALDVAVIADALPELLRWILPSRQITASGWLTLADIAPFAGLLA